jgi:two-component system response regulator PilR (NtrC family)
MATQIGAFEAANHGTLFLDEIGELDLIAQAKLLRTLETQEIRKVGSQKSQRISVRIVAATHRNLHLDVQAGRFRQDLLFRLNVVPIKIPPLRDRLGDLPLLAADLLRHLNLQFSLSDGALKILSGYSFPGNIRELRNLLQRAAIEYELNPETAPKMRSQQKVLQASHFSFLSNPAINESLDENQNQEKTEIYRILQEYQFNQSKAARALNMPLSTFNDRVRKYGIEKPRTLMRP